MTLCPRVMLVAEADRLTTACCDGLGVGVVGGISGDGSGVGVGLGVGSVSPPEVPFAT